MSTGKGPPPGRGHSASEWGRLQACQYLLVGHQYGCSGEVSRGRGEVASRPVLWLERRDVPGPGRSSEERSCSAGLARLAGTEGTLCPQGILSAAPVVSAGHTLGPAVRHDALAALSGCGEVVIKLLNLHGEWCPFACGLAGGNPHRASWLSALLWSPPLMCPVPTGVTGSLSSTVGSLTLEARCCWPC